MQVLEKVSKDALWFAVREGEAGTQQVLVVTNDRKQARKYGLLELPSSQALAQALEPDGQGGQVVAAGGSLAVTLPGLPEPVGIPVAALRERVRQVCCATVLVVTPVVTAPS
jgi:hypothetical protein